MAPTAAVAIESRCVAPKYRQFDFWIGQWDVRDGGAAIARSRVEAGRDSCDRWRPYLAPAP